MAKKTHSRQKYLKVRSLLKYSINWKEIKSGSKFKKKKNCALTDASVVDAGVVHLRVADNLIKDTREEVIAELCRHLTG